MANLGEKVLDVIKRLRQGQTISPHDVRTMERLANAGIHGMFSALVTPRAKERWECFSSLDKADEFSPQVKLGFERPVEIIAMEPFVASKRIAGEAASPIGTVDDLIVEIALDEQRRLTRQGTVQNSTTVASQANRSFMTASALSVKTPILFDTPLFSTAPMLSFIFAWKQGPNIFQSAIPSVAVYGRYMSDEEVAERRPDEGT